MFNSGYFAQLFNNLGLEVPALVAVQSRGKTGMNKVLKECLGSGFRRLIASWKALRESSEMVGSHQDASMSSFGWFKRQVVHAD